LVKNENDINVNSSTMTSFFYWIKSVIITAINVWDFRGRYSWWHFYDQSKTRVRFTWSYLLGAWVWHGVHGAQYWEVNRTENLKRFSSCPTSSACYAGTLHYIYRGLEFEFRSSHLFTLKIKFLIIRLLTKKKIFFIFTFYFGEMLLHLHFHGYPPFFHLSINITKKY
jgi:hypothetical protein